MNRRKNLFADQRRELLHTLGFGKENYLMRDAASVSFPEMLSAWITHEQCDSIESFLEKIGLAGIIDPALIAQACIGRTILGPKSCGLLSMHLPNEHVRPHEPKFSTLEVKSFRKRARNWQKANPQLPVTDLSQERFDAYSARMLKRYADLNQPVGITDIARQKRLLEVLTAFATQQGTELNEVIDRLRANYATRSKKTVSLLQDFLEQHQLYFSRDVLAKYVFHSAAVEIPAASRALRFLRQSRNLSVTELARGDRSLEAAIYAWEEGVHAIDSHKLGILVENLHLNPEEAEIFSVLVNPEFAQTTEWLLRIISEHNSACLSYPSSDAEWLARQPVFKQGGLLLGDRLAYMNAGLEPSAKTAGIDKTNLYAFVHHRQALPAYRKLLPFLQLDDVQSAYFTEIFEKTNSALNERRRAIRNPKLPVEPNDLRALDPDWLALQEPYRQGGLLLNDYLKLYQLTTKDLSVVCKVHRMVVNGWLLSTKPLIEPRLNEILTLLPLTESQTQRLREAVERSNPLIRERRNMNAKNTTLGSVLKLSDAPELFPKTKQL